MRRLGKHDAPQMSSTLRKYNKRLNKLFCVWRLDAGFENSQHFLMVLLSVLGSDALKMGFKNVIKELHGDLICVHRCLIV